MLANELVDQRRKELAEVCRTAYAEHCDREMAEVCQKNGLKITRARVQQLRKMVGLKRHESSGEDEALPNLP
jgi:hypothetical protein